MTDIATELQQSLDQPDYGPNFEKLPKEKIDELRSVISACNKRDLWARMVEIIRCTLRRYFWLGIQHGFWNADTQQLQIGPNGGSTDNLNLEDLFNGDFNIYTQNGKIFIAVFSQNAAGSRMEPDRPNDADSVKAAEEAEKYVRVYDKYNPPKVAQMEVGRLLYTDGRVLAVTRTMPDEDRLGVQEDDEGNPVPREAELTEYFGILETKVPMMGAFAEWPYCKVSKDKDIFIAKQQNPKFAKEMTAGTKNTQPNDEIARMSRIAVAENIAQLSSDTLSNLVTEDTWWLRPAAFWELADDDKRAFWIGGETENEDGSVTKTEGLFPRGIRCTFYGSTYCGAEAVSMNDEVRVMHALPGSGNSRPSLSDPMIPIQMEFNDGMGMFSELLHKCIPRTYINCSQEELSAILEQFARFGEYSPVDFPKEQPMTNFMTQEAFPEMPAGFDSWLENLQGPLAQFVTGNSPALFGAQMEDQKTATGYAQARDQSLGLMSLVWVPYLEFAASIRGQAARQAGKREEATIDAVVPDADGEDEPLSIDTRMLQRGFRCTPVTDQNFPESWTETSNTWKGLLAAAPTNPLLAENLQEPDNLVGMRDAIGLKNFVIKGADSRDLQLAEWGEMMEKGQGPIPDQEATQMRDKQKEQQAQQAANVLLPGSTPPPLPQEPPVMTSSVPISINTDDHVVHALECFSILNSPEGQKVKKASLPVWQDLEQHMMEHVAAAQAKGLIIPPPLGGPPPMPMPGPGGPAKPPIGAPPNENAA